MESVELHCWALQIPKYLNKLESVELHIGALQIPKYLNTLESVLLHSEAPSLGQKVSLDNWFLGQLVQYQAATKQLVLVKIQYTDTNNTLRFILIQILVSLLVWYQYWCLVLAEHYPACFSIWWLIIRMFMVRRCYNWRQGLTLSPSIFVWSQIFSIIRKILKNIM